MIRLLSNMPVRLKIFCIILTFLAAMAVSGVYAALRLGGILVNGPTYREIVDHKDLIADILPPPLFAVEAYALALRLAAENDPSRVEEALRDLARLQAAFEERDRLWSGSDLPAGLKAVMAGSMRQEARALFAAVRGELAPAVRAGDAEAARNVLTGSLLPHFDRHKAEVDKLARLAADEVARIEAQARERIDSTLLSVLVLAGLLAGAATFLALLTAARVTRPLAALVDFADGVSAGHLERTLDLEQRDEVGRLAGNLRRMVAALRERIAEASAGSEEAAREAERARQALAEAESACNTAEDRKNAMLHASARLEEIAGAASSATSQLSAQVGQSSQGVGRQSQRMAEIATAMDQMNATVLEVAKNASQAAEATEHARRNAQDGAAIVGRMVSGMGTVQELSLGLKSDMAELDVQVQGIGKIMNVITDIADQTNLLALNAAIEAARAGDAGRGFAVVADEVRKLAEKTMSATKQVHDAITAIQEGAHRNAEGVEQAVRAIGEVTVLARDSGKALSTIVSLVDAASDQVRSIAASSEEQSAASEQINRSVEEVNSISTENSQAMSQASLAVAELAEQTQVLHGLITEMRG